MKQLRRWPANTARRAGSCEVDDGDRRAFLRNTLSAVTVVGLGASTNATADTAPAGTVGRPHQRGLSEYRSILPEDIVWKPFAAFPPEARLAVIAGRPNEPGSYAIRVKLPGGIKLMPHRHPEDRLYTVISGVFYIGLGEMFDPEKLIAYPSGSVVVLPGGTWHFHWARSGEYVTQVTATGPLGLEYRNSSDDPRNQHHSL